MFWAARQSANTRLPGAFLFRQTIKHTNEVVLAGEFCYSALMTLRLPL
jgi:hypothetical protein